MARLKRRAARKAVKVTARHAAHGAAAKARRSPARSLVLFWAGAGFGASATCVAVKLRPSPSRP